MTPFKPLVVAVLMSVVACSSSDSPAPSGGGTAGAGGTDGTDSGTLDSEADAQQDTGTEQVDATTHQALGFDQGLGQAISRLDVKVVCPIHVGTRGHHPAPQAATGTSRPMMSAPVATSP